MVELVYKCLSPLAVAGHLKRVRCVIQKNGHPRVDVGVSRSSADKGLELLKAAGLKEKTHFARAHRSYADRLALRGGGSAGDGPVPSKLTFACWNIAGAKPKIEEVAIFAAECRIDILCLQETNLKEGETLFLRGFRCAQTWKKGPGERGLALFSRVHLPVSDLGLKSDYLQGVRVLGRKQVTLIVNVYIPYAVSAGKKLALEELYVMIMRSRERYPSCTMVIGGDFNMSASKLSDILADWDVGLKFVSVKGNSETFHREGRTSSGIDHWLVSTSHTSTCHAKVMRTYDSSDHWPVRTSLDLPVSAGNFEDPAPTCTLSRGKLESLSSEKVANHNRFAVLAALMGAEADETEDELPDVLGVQDVGAVVAEAKRKMSLDELSDGLVSTSWEVAKNLKAIKKHRPLSRCSKLKPPNLSAESRTAIRERRSIWNKVLEAAESDNSSALKKLYKDHREALRVSRDCIKADRTAGWVEFLQSGVALHRNPRQFWKWMKKVSGQKSGRSSGVAPIRNEAGQLLFDPELISKSWIGYYGNLSRDVTGHSRNQGFWSGKLPPPVLPVLTGLDHSPTWSEVNSVIRDLNTGKAPGLSKLGPEWFAFVAEDPSSATDAPQTAMGKVVFALVKRMIDESTIPKNLCTAQVCNILKKGDPAIMDNYRGISLMEIALKIACNLVNRRLSASLESSHRFCKEQAGFRRDEECMGQVISLYEICKRRDNSGLETFLAFIDFKKAFDTVPHAAMLAKLSHIGIRGKMLAFVRALYENSRITVSSSSDVLSSESVPLERGVRQGCPLSPLLFNVFINDILDECRRLGVAVPGCPATRISGLLFADDLVLLASRCEDLQAMLDFITSWSQKWEMGTNGAKCGVMSIGAGSRRVAKDRTWKLQGEVVPVVRSYKYLGILFNDNLDLPMMVRDRVDSVRKATRGLERFLRSSSIPIAVRLKMFKAVVLPIASYGGELFGMNTVLAQGIQAHVNNATKWLVGVSSGSKLAAASCVSQALGIDSIDARMSAARARAFYKLGESKTWISSLIVSPPKGRCGTWVILTRRWLIKKFPGRYLCILISDPDPVQTRVRWVHNVRDIVSGETLKSLSLKQKTLKAYIDAGFSGMAPVLLKQWGMDVSMSRAFTDFLKIRTGFLMTGKKGAKCKWLRPEFAEECPLCGEAVPETLRHYLLDCSAWASAREEFIRQSEPSLTSVTWHTLERDAKIVLLLGGQVGEVVLPNYVRIDPPHLPWGQPLTSVLVAFLGFLAATGPERNRVLWSVAVDKSRRPSGMAVLRPLGRA